MRILCFGPGELQPQLNAVTLDQLNHNILTQRGLRLLQGIRVHPRQEPKLLTDRTGFAFAVQDVVDLQIWRDGDTRSVDQRFYVLMSDDTLRQRDLHEQRLHVILSPNCFPPDSPDSEGDSVATMRLSNPSSTERAVQERVAQERQRAAEERDRLMREQDRIRREQDRARAEQQSRETQNGG
ncbi:uncharacterized protein LDX57_010378 [Aspergillus melleus]|uniref:uncharacterized protein n=1 Tax=Aspergillus melleus TaxID=138277 RepID=UPI001E8EBF1F|nr:uncharacterized protein LDX57_010378 [Aspergillus melleus]KAH8432752.1 hypothetical protein LDX57_010378 [Aspergillus melleus]